MIRPAVRLRRDHEMPLGTRVFLKGARPAVTGKISLYRLDQDGVRRCWIITEQGELLGDFPENRLAPLN